VTAASPSALAVLDASAGATTAVEIDSSLGLLSRCSMPPVARRHQVPVIARRVGSLFTLVQEPARLRATSRRWSSTGVAAASSAPRPVATRLRKVERPR
jgi:hypothetical protein